MTLVDRRNFLKHGLLSLSILNINPFISTVNAQGKYISMNPNELYILDGWPKVQSASGDFCAVLDRNNYLTNRLWDDSEPVKQLKLGNHFKVVPKINIEKYKPTTDSESNFSHVIDEFYEFVFRPVEMFLNGLDQNRFHYIIELSKGIKVFHFNWIHEKDDYLSLNQYYHGYGSIEICGNPSTENKHIPTTTIEEITIEGKLIRSKKVYSSGSLLEKFEYRENFQKFKRSKYLFSDTRSSLGEDVDIGDPALVYKIERSVV